MILTDLPSEILYLVLGFIDEQKDVYSLLFVCKLWNALAGPRCRSTLVYDGQRHSLRLPEIASMILDNREFAQNIRTLKISGWNIVRRRGPMRTRAWLGTSLDPMVEKEYQRGMEDRLILLLMTSLPNVTHLDIGHPVSDGPLVSGRRLSRLIDRPVFPKLQSIHYTGLPELTAMDFIMPFLTFHVLEFAQLNIAYERRSISCSVNVRHLVIGDRYADIKDEDDGRRTTAMEGEALSSLLHNCSILEVFEYYHNDYYLTNDTPSPQGVVSSVRGDLLKKLVISNFDPVNIFWNFNSVFDVSRIESFPHLPRLEDLTVQLQFLGHAPLNLREILPRTLRRLTILECTRVGSTKLSGTRIVHFLDNSFRQWRQEDLISELVGLKGSALSSITLGDADWGEGSIVPRLRSILEPISVFEDRSFPSWIKGKIIPTHGQRVEVSLPR